MDFLNRHPVICFLLGCLILSSCQATDHLGNYLGALTCKAETDARK